jgi:outer membrane protein
VSLTVGASCATALAEAKIGYVDMQKAIQDTSTGKKAKSELETEFNKKKKELEKKEADLKKMNEDLEKKSMVLSDEIKAQRQQELQNEMMKYRELVGKSQVEIQKRERDLTLPIVEKLRGIIDGIAKKESYTVVLEKSEQSVLWADKQIDLTDRIVKEFEKSAKK